MRGDEVVKYVSRLMQEKTKMIITWKCHDTFDQHKKL
jgi:hypothetical protein